MKLTRVVALIAFAATLFALAAATEHQFISPQRNPIFMGGMGVLFFVSFAWICYLLGFPLTRKDKSMAAEIDRLRAGLKFYAEQQHMILEDWEEPDDPGWLCPPTNEEIEEKHGTNYDGLPWMVEDGGVARIILRGGRIVGTAYDELIVRMDPAPRRVENNQVIVPCYKFDFGDAPLILRQTDGVHNLVNVIGESNQVSLIVESVGLTKRQLREIPEWGS